MKKTIFSVTALLTLCIITCTAYAAKVGDVIGFTRYTDIVASINNHNIASFNIDGYTGVVAEDLRNYGFDVTWVAEERALYITRGTTNNVASTYVAPKIRSSVLGTKAQNILYTDIKCYINGNYVQSYNINGQTIINFNDLNCFGSVAYDNATRKLELTVNDGLAFRPNSWYTNLPKITMYAADGRTTTVYKHEAEAYAEVGWYYEPVVTMYAADGRTTTVAKSEISAYEKVGWYTAEKYVAVKYSYLAGNDFRSIRRQYSSAVASGAVVYPYADSQGHTCVLVYIDWKIGNSRWKSYYMHDLTSGTSRENPWDYYKNLANRAWGASKIAYLGLANDSLSAAQNALTEYNNALSGKPLTKGVFVNAKTLNL